MPLFLLGRTGRPSSEAFPSPQAIGNAAVTMARSDMAMSEDAAGIMHAATSKDILKVRTPFSLCTLELLCLALSKTASDMSQTTRKSCAAGNAVRFLHYAKIDCRCSAGFAGHPACRGSAGIQSHRGHHGCQHPLRVLGQGAWRLEHAAAQQSRPATHGQPFLFARRLQRLWRTGQLCSGKCCVG